MTDLASEFAADSPRAPADAELTTVARLAAELVALDADIAAREADLKALADRRRVIAEGELPAAMDNCGDRGIASFTLNDGTKVGVRLLYRCGQLDNAPSDDPRKRPLEDRLAALEWLDANGHGDLPKRVVTVTLGRDSAAVAEQILAYVADLRRNDLAARQALTVPWGTLSGFCRELDRAAGDPPPLDLLGVQKIKIAEVKRSKANGDEL